jgi:hypothetical protein
MTDPTQQQPAVAPTVSTAPARSRWRVSKLPPHIGPARTSTVILVVLFLTIGALYLYIRPETTVATETGTQQPASTTAPAAPTPAETTAPAPETTTDSEAPPTTDTTESTPSEPADTTTDVPEPEEEPTDTGVLTTTPPPPPEPTTEPTTVAPPG